jgi:hypothetical protein
MQVRLKKTKDGRPSVTFVRPDGSSTTGRLGAGDFGPVHDLTHYAVETTLGLTQGFYGLLAAGWDIPDFEVKSTGQHLPDDALVAECLVGQLSNTVFQPQDISVTDFNWLVHQAVTALRPQAQVPALTDTTLHRLRENLATLLAHWRALPPGETLALAWPAPQASLSTNS